MQRAPVYVVMFLGLVMSPTVLADPEPVRQPGNFGLGLGGGTSTAGISMKYFMSSSMAVQGVVGAGYGNSGRGNGPGDWDGGFGAGADLLFEMPAFHESQDLELAWNAGPGVGLWIMDDWAALAVSGVLGFEFNVSALPIDIVLEYRPRLRVVPDVDFDFVNFSGHIRYIF